MPPLPHIFDFDPDTLADWLAQHGQPRFRAQQVLHWVYQQRITDPQQMTNLPQPLRELLSGQMRFITGHRMGHQLATDGTQKLLLQWPAAQTPAAAEPEPSSTALPLLDQQAGDPTRQTECVMIPARSTGARDRRTACISSQIGCPVGCTFCASGLGGLDGNLTPGQILEQLYQLNQLPGVYPITNVVFMGMGEPLANFAAVSRAIQTLIAEWGFNLAGRRVTLSTVGLPAQIRRLAELQLPITLAISLHAPNDALRRQLIPWAQRVRIEQLIDAGRDYFRKTGREVTLEYILLGRVNDQPEHARELATIARQLRSNINLIRYNEVAGLPYARPRDDDVHAFQRILRDKNINAHIRASRGRDIAAACGQLRHEARPDTPQSLQA